MEPFYFYTLYVEAQLRELRDKVEELNGIIVTLRCQLTEKRAEGFENVNGAAKCLRGEDVVITESERGKYVLKKVGDIFKDVNKRLFRYRDENPSAFVNKEVNYDDRFDTTSSLSELIK